MRNLIFLVIIVILGLFQVTFLDYIRLFNVKPDLLLLCMVLSSLFLNFKWAFALGISCGVLKDILSAKTFGLNTLVFSLWILLIIKLSKKITLDNIFIRVALIFLISLVNNVIERLFLLSFGNSIPLGISLRIIFLEPIYTSFVSFLIFRYINPESLIKVVEK